MSWTKYYNELDKNCNCNTKIVLDGKLYNFGEVLYENGLTGDYKDDCS